MYGDVTVDVEACVRLARPAPPGRTVGTTRASLICQVERALHAGRPRVGQDRAAARAPAGRTPSGPSTTRDHRAPGQQLGDTTGPFVGVEHRGRRSRRRRASRSMASAPRRRAEEAPLIAVAGRRHAARGSPATDVPAVERGAERAAGVAGRRLHPDPSNGPSRSRRPLATQFRATPPARQASRSPVIAAACAGHAQHDLLGHLLDRAGQVGISRFVIAAVGLAGGPAEEPRRSGRLVIRRPAGSRSSA